MLSETFQKRFGFLPVNLLALNEAHCVSVWGEAFRPNYFRLREVWQRVGKPPRVALTATVDERILADIQRRLGFRSGVITVRANPFRPNLTVRVERPGDSTETKSTAIEERNRAARQRLTQRLDGRGPALVYRWSRATAGGLFEKIHRIAQARGY